MIQWMLAIWSRVPQPFLNAAWTSESSSFMYLLLKRSLKDFDHYFNSMWNECNCTVVWTFMGIAPFGDWNENSPFPVLRLLLNFPNCWHIDCSTSTASSFRILNRSAVIPLPPLAFFVVILPKAYSVLPSNISSSRWVTTLLCLSGSLRPFLYGSSVYSCHSFLISFVSVRSSPLLSFIVLILA